MESQIMQKSTRIDGENKIKRDKNKKTDKV